MNEIKLRIVVSKDGDDTLYGLRKKGGLVLMPGRDRLFKQIHNLLDIADEVASDLADETED